MKKTILLGLAVTLVGCAGLQKKKMQRERETMIVDAIIQGLENNESSSTIYMRLKTLVVEKLKGGKK